MFSNRNQYHLKPPPAGATKATDPSDPSFSNSSSQKTELKKYTDSHDSILRSDSSGDRLSPEALVKLSAQCRIQYQQSHEVGCINAAIENLETVLKMIIGDHSERDTWINDLGTSYLLRYKHTRSQSDLEEARRLMQETVDLTSSGNHLRSSRLSDLGVIHSYLFAANSEHADGQKAIEFFNLALDCAPQGHANIPGYLHNLGTVYQSLFEAFGQPDHIEKAADCFARAVVSTPENDSEKPSRLYSSGMAYWAIFQRSRGHADLGRAINNLELAVTLIPDQHPQKRTWLNGLGVAYNTRFQMSREGSDLEKGAACLTRALDLAPDGHPFRHLQLYNLGVAHQVLFDTLGRREDIEKAANYLNQAVKIVPDDHSFKPVCLNGLGNVHRLLFETFRKEEDINDAITHLDLAVKLTPDGDPGTVSRLQDLSSAHRSYFFASGQRDALHHTSDCLTLALKLLPDGHPDKPELLNNLGNVSQLLYETCGGYEHINQAVAHFTLAADLTPDGHPNKASLLQNLGGTHYKLFETFGREDNIRNAAEYLRRAVRLAPDGQKDKPSMLNGLGLAHSSLFKKFHARSDLIDAARYFSQALKLTPDSHSDKPTWLSNSGITHQLLFDRFGNEEDLTTAVECHRLAVELTPSGHPKKPQFLANSGKTYWSLFRASGEDKNLDKADESISLALSLTLDGHPSKPNWLSSLGYIHLHRFQQNRSRSLGMSALNDFKLASLASTGKPSEKLDAATMWARLSTFLLEPALDPYKRTMELLSEAVWLGGSVSDRYTCLEVDAKGLVTAAAAAAISMHHYDTALEWLEQGRCMVWNQLLELRSPLDELSDAYPEMANQLRHVSGQLECSPMSSSDKASAEIAQQYRVWAVKREQLIESIRQLPGFDDFLRPQKIAKLLSYIQTDVVVTINFSSDRCDVLVIQPGSQSIGFIPLPNFSYQHALKAQQAMGHRVRGRGSERKVKRSKDPETPMKDILLFLWESLVHPVLTYLGISRVASVEELPHIAWCLTGVLSTLPIHAAGNYSTGSADTILYNLAISSYIPNLSALARPSIPTTPFSGMLAVGMGLSVRGLAPLAGVRPELSCVQERFQDMQYDEFVDDDACVDTILHALTKHSWAHFACHASQDGTNPLNSAFELYDGTINLSDIMRTHLPNAEFAFLSACQTASGDTELPDEALHLAAGLLMAGYRTVIASMWAINDEDARVVAEKVYEYMLEGGVPDSRRAAKALHKAMSYLRDFIGVNEYSRWAPYIHMGR